MHYCLQCLYVSEVLKMFHISFQFKVLTPPLPTNPTYSAFLSGHLTPTPAGKYVERISPVPDELAEILSLGCPVTDVQVL